MAHSNRCCHDAQALLPAYVEGELETFQKDRVAAHLAICASCRREEALFVRALRVLNLPEVREPIQPGDLYPGFAAKLDRIQPRWTARRFQLQLAGGFACLALIAIAVASPLVYRMVSNSQSAESIGPVITPKFAKATAPHVVPQPSTGSTNDYDNGQAGKRFETGPQSVSTDEQHPLAGNSQAPVAPESRVTKTTPNPRREHQRIVKSFWDVQPMQGETAGQQIARIHKQQTAAGLDATTSKTSSNVASAEGPSYVPIRDERVQVGKVVTQVQTGYETDASGRRKSIDVNIGTFVSSEEKQK